jgi:hypothetical protein
MARPATSVDALIGDYLERLVMVTSVLNYWPAGRSVTIPRSKISALKNWELGPSIRWNIGFTPPCLCDRGVYAAWACGQEHD